MANPAEIMALSASSPLPVPIGREDKGLENGHSEEKENGVYGQSPSSLQGTSPRELPFPYQALPVTTATITEHLTPALPVIEPSQMSHEVGLERFAAAHFQMESLRICLLKRFAILIPAGARGPC
jgi:hypothetical protein